MQSLADNWRRSPLLYLLLAAVVTYLALSFRPELTESGAGGSRKASKVATDGDIGILPGGGIVVRSGGQWPISPRAMPEGSVGIGHGGVEFKTDGEWVR